jgi:asparagine synthase (glutamine-hydrolysing)
MTRWFGTFSTSTSTTLISHPSDQSGSTNHTAPWSSDDHRLSLSIPPVVSHCGTFILLLQGEVYNHAQIRHSLRFRSWSGDSASETLVEGLCQRGPSLLLDIRGVFILAAYDTRKTQLLLARDRIGVQSLYLQWQRDRLFFANHSSLLPYGNSLDDNLARSFLFSDHSGCMTCFPSSDTTVLSSLPPGTVVRVNHSRPHDLIRYWPSQPRPTWTPLPIRNHISASSFLRRQLEDVLFQQMASISTPIFLLSTGFGSSLLSALACRLRAESTTTLSVSLPGSDISFSSCLSGISKHYGARHETLSIADKTAISWLEQGILQSDLILLADPHQYLLLRALSDQSIDSFFSGLGCRDLFGGTHLHRRLARIPLISCLPSILQRSLIHFLSLNSPNLVSSTSDYYSVQPFSPLDSSHLYLPNASDSRNPHQLLPFKDKMISQLWGKLCWLNLFGFTEPHILRPLASICSLLDLVAHLPFLDPRILEIAARVPQRFHRVGYGLLLKATEDLYLPYAPSNSHPSHNLPMSQWMLGPLHSLCLSRIDSLAKSRLLDNDWLYSQWSAFEAGQLRWQSAWRLILLGGMEFRDF